MNFNFDRFRNAAAGAKDTAVKAAEDTANTARLNSSIREEQKKIESLYGEIGKLYYDQFRDEPGEGFEGFVEAITASFKTIDDCNARISEIKGTVICKTCGAEIPKGSEFCGKCGTRVEKMKPVSETEETEIIICENCGAKLSPSNRFCTSCGAPVTKKGEIPEEKPEDAVESADGSVFTPEANEPEEPVFTPEANEPEEPVSASEENESEPEPAPRERPRFCTNCGAKLESGALFCTECGTRVE